MDIGDLVIYKNNQLIAFNKPSTVPVQPDKSEAPSLLDLAERYTKKRLFLINRIDRPASGIVLFAKNKNALANIHHQFKERLVKKSYLAVVGNPPPKHEDTLINFLRKKQEINKTFVYDRKVAYSKKAELQYTLRGNSRKYTLLEINLITGRHHQIRAQLASIGCPIKGDTKYGFKRSNPNRSIHLHGWKLHFFHPVSKERIELEAEPPKGVVWEAFDFLSYYYTTT